MNLCKCGCGTQVKGTWAQGHNPKNKGRRFSDEHRRRISEANKGRHSGEKHPFWGKKRSEETCRKIGDGHRGKTISLEARLKISATKLANGASEKPAAIHRWLLRWHPKTGTCEWCGASGKTDHASLTLHVYTRDREDYAELCPSCHLKLDYDQGSRKMSRRVQKECDNCGTAYVVTQSRAARSRYCSEACRLARLGGSRWRQD